MRVIIRNSDLPKNKYAIYVLINSSEVFLANCYKYDVIDLDNGELGIVTYELIPYSNNEFISTLKNVNGIERM